MLLDVFTVNIQLTDNIKPIDVIIIALRENVSVLVLLGTGYPFLILKPVLVQMHQVLGFDRNQVGTELSRNRVPEILKIIKIIIKITFPDFMLLSKKRKKIKIMSKKIVFLGTTRFSSYKKYRTFCRNEINRN